MFFKGVLFMEASMEALCGYLEQLKRYQIQSYQTNDLFPKHA